MKVMIFGASGMVGQGVLRECLLNQAVEEVLVIGRSPVGRRDDKLREIVRADMSDLSPIRDQLLGYDACYYCLGVSSAGMSEADYRRVTYDLTLSIARTLAELNPGMTFIYVSGAGTDSTGKGSVMWARIKGETENALLMLPFKAAYMLRPGIIQPMNGIMSKTRLYRVIYRIAGPLAALARRLSPRFATTTEHVGRAMIILTQDGSPRTYLGNQDINALGV